MRRIYRGTESGFIPAPDNLILETPASSWIDPTPNPWGYHYKITALDYAGNEGEDGSPSQYGCISAAQDGPESFRTALQGAVPNPFNPATTIGFEMATPGHARLKVFDAAGRLVTTLVDEARDAGHHVVTWRGQDDAGRMSAAGVYLYRLEVGGYSETKRMVMMK